MQYADNSKQFTAILNKKIPLPQLLNALGHIATGLTSLSTEETSMTFLRYEDGDGGAHPAISKFPFIVLEADNGNQIRKVRQAAIEARLLYNDFTCTMLGMSAEDQLAKTKRTPEAELDYFGLVLFGPTEIIKPLTKKFSLFK